MRDRRAPVAPRAGACPRADARSADGAHLRRHAGPHVRARTPLLAVAAALFAAALPTLAWAQAGGAWRVGQRVEVRSDDGWFATSVLAVGTGLDAGKVQVQYGTLADGTPNYQWVSTTLVRRAGAPPRPAAASADAPGRTAITRAPRERAAGPGAAPTGDCGFWQGSGRVEAWAEGRWEPGTVVRLVRGADACLVSVMLDGTASVGGGTHGGVSRGVTVPLAHVRRVIAAPAAPRPSATAGGALPAGRYRCVSFLSTGSTMTLGDFVVREPGAHEWRTTASTTAGRHRYDAATGRIAFDGGLRGFVGGASVQQATFDRDPRTNAPRVSFQYQRAGGANWFDATCVPE